MNIGFIGSGNIATAIISGSINSGYIIPENIYIYDIDSSKTQNLAKNGVNVSADNKALIDSSDIVFLTIKPQIMDTVLSDIKDCNFYGKTVVSVAAGITTDYVKSYIGKDLKIIRVMPNTPLMYMNGAAALVKCDGVDDNIFEFVKGIFDCGGVSVSVDESLIDAVTGVSGSTPALFFRCMKNIIEEAVELGINENDAKSLVIRTAIGSAIMLKESGMSADKLIKMVKSPNGTTEAGLNCLDRLGFDASVKGFVKDATNRSIELKK